MESDRLSTLNIIYIEAPVEEVWWATVHPDGVNAWLSDIARFSGSPDAPRPGDRYTFAYGDITNETEIVELEPLRRLVLSDAYISRLPSGERATYLLRTAYTLRPTPDGIRYEVHVRGYTDDEIGQWIRDCMYVGWQKALFNLKSVLEMGLDLRDAIYGYPRLGAATETVPAHRRAETGAAAGIYLMQVFEGSPAARAGLQAGDVLVTLGGRPIPAYADYVKALSHFKDGARVPIEYVRRGERRVTETVLSSDQLYTGLVEFEESQRLIAQR